jgi:hypothetical protein
VFAAVAWFALPARARGEARGQSGPIEGMTPDPDQRGPDHAGS